jgi:hypothetical protein
MKTPSVIALDKALESLTVAAEAIKNMDDVHDVEVDNDNSGGEVYFTTNGCSFALRLVQIDEIEE